MSEDESETIWAASFVSHRTRRGMVSLRFGEKEAQLTVDQAREVATNIARAAEAAETDEMCLALMGDDVGLPLIQLLRRYREVRLGVEAASWAPAEIARRLREQEDRQPARRCGMIGGAQ